ncbi:hypothetical protein SDC9_49842 [bioreactor metagenome]|jgi:hypothetical protein|uniref:EF-hand domain-containing protein n=1 Tax=bioreactor metagenome TaxID=1076179 RepID=A0A644WI75_9ZZZZ
MKKIRFIFLPGILALCLLAGCSSQSQKSAANIAPTGNSVSEKTAEAETAGKTLGNGNTSVPVSNDLENSINVKAHDNSSMKATGISSGAKTSANTEDGSGKITDTGNNTKAPTSDVSQDANVQNNNSGTVGGYCISNQNKYNVTVPKVNYELDIDKDGTISSADYKLSGMSQEDFASKLVSNGNVGTASEAKQVIKGDITVMCGVFSGTCN